MELEITEDVQDYEVEVDPLEPPTPPVISHVQLQSGSNPVLLLSGTHLGNPHELTVNFVMGLPDDPSNPEDPQTLPKDVAVCGENSPDMITGGGDTLTVRVPSAVVLGLSTVSITRELPGPMLLKSNEFEMSLQDNPYAFVAQHWENAVAVFETGKSRSDREAEQVSSIALSSAQENSTAYHPRHAAATHDWTRVYVTSPDPPGIAVLDALALQQIDADPYSPAVDWITDALAGSHPFQIVIAPDDRYAYVTDYAPDTLDCPPEDLKPYECPVCGKGRIHVLDIDPYSSSYHQVVRTIELTPGACGLRGLAISQDGGRLYAAAPSQYDFTMQRNPDCTAPGHIFEIDVNQESNTAWSFRALPVVADAQFDVSMTERSGTIAFTNFWNDNFGVGIINNLGLAPRQRYVPLNLGLPNDSFDVNNAKAIAYLPRDVLGNSEAWAFVAGWNNPDYREPDHYHGVKSESPFSPYPAGSNIGIIKDVLGANPTLVAATIPLPRAYPEDLAFTPDWKYLYVTYPHMVVQGTTDRGAVFIYDVDELINTVLAPPDRVELQKEPVDDVNPAIRHQTFGIGGYPLGLAIQSIREIDLDIDSDNDNRFNIPDRSPEEDQVEDDPNKPGKYICANNDDSDQDGIPDFADGFDLDGVRGSLDDRNVAEKFIPLILDVPPPIDLSKAKIRFLYSASDPGGVTPTGTAPNVVYVRPGGKLRIWKESGNSERKDDYVAPEQEHCAADLGLSPLRRTVTLYVEGIDGSTALQLFFMASGSSASHWDYYQAAPTTYWGRWTPAKHDEYVLVKKTRRWLGDVVSGPAVDLDMPAIITPQEVLADKQFELLNTKHIQNQIDTIWSVLDSEILGLSLIKLPNLFLGRSDSSSAGIERRSAVAFNPGPTNLQVLNANISNPAGSKDLRLYVPQQWVYMDSSGLDIFEDHIKKSLEAALTPPPGAPWSSATVFFVDDWDYYHRAKGEVHCGSVVKRALPPFDWWSKQPASPAPLTAAAPIFNTAEDSCIAASEPLSLGAEDATSDLWWSVIEAAKDRWTQLADANLPSDAFTAVDIYVDDIPGSYLAWAQPIRNGPYAITVDVDAAGLGWFVDPTPYDDEEFPQTVHDWELHAKPGGQAAGLIDLLTVLAHEFGHVLGLDDVSAAIDPTRLMTAILTTGVRRLPSSLDLAPLQTENGSGATGMPTYRDRPSSSESLPAPTPDQNRNDAGPPSARQGHFAAQRAPSIGITNGSFAVADPVAPDFGWTVRGEASVVGGEGVLGEGGRLNAGISQTFVVPEGAKYLQFDIVELNLHADPLSPPDTFEVALLEESNMTPLSGHVAGLSRTDALLNIQPSNEVYYGASVAVPEAAASGQPVSLTLPSTVEVALPDTAAGTEVTLYFDLLGFGQDNSSVIVDNVRFTALQLPTLDFELDPATGSGAVGDDLTNFTSVNLIGQTEPDQSVTLDLDEDGFDDGITTADDQGQFVFQATPLLEAANVVRMQAVNQAGAATATRTISLDAQPPEAALITPTPQATIQDDLGYVELQWTDTGVAGLDESTFGPDDVSLAGVSIDEVQLLGNGSVRYRYGQDGDQLAVGTVVATVGPGEVADLAGNSNAAQTFSFDFGEPSIHVPPEVDLNGPEGGIDYAATFVEDSGPTSIVALDMTVVDPDSPQLTSATVHLTNLVDDGQEVLAVDTQGTSIVADYEASSRVSSLAGTDMVANYQQVLRTLTYENTSQDPDPTSRIVQVVVTDGESESVPALSTIEVVPVNDPPVVDLNGPTIEGLDVATTFTEGVGAVSIVAPTVCITDVDDVQLESATVTITNLLDGTAEALLVETGDTPISAAYQPAQGELRLTGTASWAVYEEVLRSLRYDNASRDPVPQERHITVVVYDDDMSPSKPARALVDIVPCNHSICGYVYVDVNNDGIKGDAELALPNVPVTLAGPVTRVVLTGADGSYFFGDLPHGTYSVTETQPSAFIDGQETPGEPVGCEVQDNRFCHLEMSGDDTSATGYNFGERGLRAEWVTKQLLLSSTPEGDQLLRQLNVVGGEGWYGFEAEYDAAVTVEMGAEVRDAVIEIYDDGWMPVTLSNGRSQATAEVQEGTNYLIYVAGEGLETVTVVATPENGGLHTNPENIYDVSADGHVSPIDALFVIQELNQHGSHVMAGPGGEPPYVDVDGDGYVSPIDALHVINYLNQRGSISTESASAEGEGYQPMCTLMSGVHSSISYTVDDGNTASMAEGDAAPVSLQATPEHGRPSAADRSEVALSGAAATEVWLTTGLNEMMGFHGGHGARVVRWSEKPLSDAQDADDTLSTVSRGVVESGGAVLPRAAWRFGRPLASTTQRRRQVGMESEPTDGSVLSGIEPLLTEMAEDVVKRKAWSWPLSRVPR